MTYYTARINRDSPHGQAWDEDPTQYDSEREAFLSLVRRLDAMYPDKWKLNGGYQIVLKSSGPGSWVLALIDKHQTRIEELEDEIMALQHKLRMAKVELDALHTAPARSDAPGGEERGES